MTVTGTKHCTGMEGGPEGRSWGRGRRWDVKSRGGGWALQGRDDGDLGKVMLVMEEEELQDLDGVVRGKAREDAGSPRKAPGSPLWVWHIHWPQVSISGSTHPHPTPKGDEHSAGPTMEALAGDGTRPPQGSQATSAAGGWEVTMAEGLPCQRHADPASCLAPAFSAGAAGSRRPG